MDFVTNVSFLIPYEGIAFVSETPKISWKDKILHNETDMAVKYADGWGIYVYNGVVVTEKIIKTPEKLTKQDWLKEENLEVRRVIQERMGSDFVKKIGGKVLDKGTKGILYGVDLKDDPEKTAHYVKVKDSSTSREYYLRVSPTITKADTAVAWTFGFDNPEEYIPVKET